MKYKHVCEVGFLDLETSQIRGFIEAGVRATVIDVNHTTELEAYENVTFHHAAILPHKTALFRTSGTSTYWQGMLGHVDSYNALFKPGQHTFLVPGHSFAEFDTGDIDLLCIDIEGCEIFVLRDMKSRPVEIRVEMEWKKYKNPYYDEIVSWMQENDYIFNTKIQADHVYTKTCPSTRT